MERSLADLQARLNSILAGLGVDVSNDRLRILAADNSEVGINLGSTEGQQALEPHLDGLDLLDNLSTLMTTGSAGASNSWLPMQTWLLRLRRKGIAVLLIHHAGVNGQQRGTSPREEALDTVIALRRPTDYSPEEGAQVEVHIEKARTWAGREPYLRGHDRGIHERIWEGGDPVGGAGPETARPPSGGRIVPGRPYRSQVADLLGISALRRVDFGLGRPLTGF